MPTICLIPTVILYGIATILAWIDGWRARPVVRRNAFRIFLAGLALHTIYLPFSLFSHGGIAIGSRHATVGLLAWSAAIGYAVLARNIRWQYLGIVFFPLLFLLQIQIAVTAPDSAVAMTTPGAWLLPTHLIFAMIALAIFLLSVVSGIVMMWGERRLKSRRPGLMALRMPDIPMLERVLARLLFIGFAILTLTLATGMGLRLDGVTSSGGHLWWALGTWTMYGIVLQARISRGWGRAWLPLSFIGFAVILLSFLEVHGL